VALFAVMAPVFRALLFVAVTRSTLARIIVLMHCSFLRRPVSLL
jgi:hypothetical protein